MTPRRRAGGNSDPRFRARYPASSGCVGAIRGEVKAVARELGIEGEQLADVALAVSDAATDAVVHASLGGDDPQVGLRVDVGDLEMLVTISDDGDDVRTGSERADLRLTFPRSTPVTRQDSLDVARWFDDGGDYRSDLAYAGDR
jgi:anti-sigma regulatory factor (Ser/Thr protein kinase)